MTSLITWITKLFSKNKHKKISIEDIDDKNQSDIINDYNIDNEKDILENNINLIEQININNDINDVIIITNKDITNQKKSVTFSKINTIIK